MKNRKFWKWMNLAEDGSVRVLELYGTIAEEDYVKVDIDIAGVNELNAGESGAQTVQTLSLTLPSYRCTQATLKYASRGTAKASVSQTICVKECNISIDNGTEDAPATYCTQQNVEDGK